MPWVYEMGVEVYRVAKHGSSDDLEEAVREFRRAVEFVVHEPTAREVFGRNKDMYLLWEEIDSILVRVLDRIETADGPLRRIRPNLLGDQGGSS